VVLTNSLAIPELLYLLRTSNCGDNLQQSILPGTISSLEDGSLESIDALWASQSNLAKPVGDVQHI